MSATLPIAWVHIEDAFTGWVRKATGFADADVRLVPQRESGASRGPSPKVLVFLLSMLQLGKAGRRQYTQTMQQRYTVTAVGPGTVGVDFFPGLSLTAQPINYAAGVGESTVSSAAGLLAELVANLPAGYSASADPGDTSSVLVDGSDVNPVFAALPTDPGLLSVADTVPNKTDLIMILHRLVWRIQFRAGATHGAGQATRYMMDCQLWREQTLDPALEVQGFSPAGYPTAQPSITADRVETNAILDVAIRGRMTLALARQVGRAIGTANTQLLAS